jgi:hypothetical protein
VPRRCSQGHGREIRETQKGAAARSNARQLVDRYNMFRRKGAAASAGVGRVKAYEKEVLQNIAIWLSTGGDAHALPHCIQRLDHC